jgi:predicted enzyme related to lactoylglutathione lyase
MSSNSSEVPQMSRRLEQHQVTTAVLSSTLLSLFGGGSMKVSHVHCRVRDLPAAARWFQQALHATAVFNNERMAWLGFGDFGVILDAAPADSALTLGFDSEDCDADFRTVTARGAETIEGPAGPPVGRTLRLSQGPRRPNRRDRTATETHLSPPSTIIMVGTAPEE